MDQYFLTLQLRDWLAISTVVHSSEAGGSPWRDVVLNTIYPLHALYPTKVLGDHMIMPEHYTLCPRHSDCFKNQQVS